ncbi:hypothetical protein Tco_0623495, partial [Tanacetum coccineum]
MVAAEVAAAVVEWQPWWWGCEDGDMMVMVS